MPQRRRKSLKQSKQEANRYKHRYTCLSAFLHNHLYISAGNNVQVHNTISTKRQYRKGAFLLNVSKFKQHGERIVTALMLRDFCVSLSFPFFALCVVHSDI